MNYWDNFAFWISDVETEKPECRKVGKMMVIGVVKPNATVQIFLDYF